MRGLLFLIALFAHAQAQALMCSSKRPVPPETIVATPGIRTVVFVAQDLRDGACWQTDPTGIAERHAPWSTFKFPHFLIALESGAVASSREVVRWDPAKRPPQSYWPEAWKQDQSLETAFSTSAAWPFQELVPKIGPANYLRWLERFGFGNLQAPPDRDDFWLGGPLAVSAVEQVGFLACIAAGGCGVSPQSLRALEEAAAQGERHGHTLYAKTGSGPLKPRDFSGPFEGWYVGYLRSAEGVATVAFATYVRSDNYASLRTYRENVSRHLLSELGLWPR